MQIILPKDQKYDVVALGGALLAKFNTTYGLSTASQVLTLYTQPGDDEAAIEAFVLDAVAHPKPVPPEAVTMRQARLALLQAGLLTQVNTAVANMPGTQGDAARITWEFSGEVRRDDPLVSQLASALSLMADQLDQLFVVAGGL